MELEKEPRALAGERARTSGDAAHLLAILGGEVGRIPGLARAEALPVPRRATLASPHARTAARSGASRSACALSASRSSSSARERST